MELLMASFPLFFDLTDKKVLVVGGGKIAHDKLEKLVQFTKEITVITPEMSLETHTLIGEHCLTLYHRPYRTGDAEGFDVVVIAADGEEVHRSIYDETRHVHTWVNSALGAQYSDFFFPSFVRQDDLTVAFSTDGASPAFARHLRRWFAHVLPEETGDFLRYLRRLRMELPRGKERMAKFDATVSEFFDKHFHHS
jgi:precorrin-2 dehydrogenase/sirohydrochlorin ferrochelatase